MKSAYIEDKIRPVLGLLKELKDDPFFGSYKSYIESVERRFSNIVTEEARREDARWENMPYRRMSLSKCSILPEFVRILYQKFGADTFDRKRVNEFFDQMEEEGELPSVFSNLRMYELGRYMRLINGETLRTLFGKGILERRYQSHQEGCSYKIVPEAIKDLYQKQ